MRASAEHRMCLARRVECCIWTLADSHPRASVCSLWLDRELQLTGVLKLALYGLVGVRAGLMRHDKT